MKNKKKVLKLLILTAGIIIGTCFAMCSQVQATDITSAFTGVTVNRDSVKKIESGQSLIADGPLTFEKKDSGYKYTEGAQKIIWDIVEKAHPEEEYYCLNEEQGFLTDEDEYDCQLELSYEKLQESRNHQPELSEENYNKLLWVLDNMYIPNSKIPSMDIYEDPLFINLLKKADIDANKDSDTIYNLTLEDVIIAQRLAIWHFTNDFDDIESLNGEGVSSQDQPDPFGTGGNKLSRINKIKKLYNYFVDNADPNYQRKTPTLKLTSDSAEVTEDGDSYIFGPYHLIGENAERINTITPTSESVGFTLLDGSKEEVVDNDFLQVVEKDGTGENKGFYLKFSKNDIDEKTKLTVTLTYTYEERTLTLLTSTNDKENTQPLVHVEVKTISKELKLNIQLQTLGIQLQKIDEKGNIITASEATFDISKDGQKASFHTSNGLIDLESQKITKDSFEFVYKIKETTPPSGYTGITEELTVKIAGKMKEQDGKMVIYDVTITDGSGQSLDESKIKAKYDAASNKVIIQIVNTKKQNEYTVKLLKVSEDGVTPLEGAWFKVGDGDATLVPLIGEEIGTGKLEATGEIELVYKLEETQAPEGYLAQIGVTELKIKATVEEKGEQYEITKVELEEPIEGIEVSVQDNVILIKVKNEPIEKKFDLALRKFITAVNDQTYDREPVVDTSTIAETGTATYRQTKQPIEVQAGDVVTYTIRVYNEGDLDGYANQITDHLPNNLLPILDGVEGIDPEVYADEIEFNSNWLWAILDNPNTVVTTITSELNSDTYSILTGLDVEDTKLNGYQEGSDTLDYIDVQLKCLVTDKAVTGEYLTNIAEITAAEDINGNEGDGEDSVLNSIGDAELNNLSDYKTEEANGSTKDSYIPGTEDDDDFEKLIVKSFDLALRKFITQVGDQTYQREPVVDTSLLGTLDSEGNVITDAEYKHSKEPVIVEKGDIITYTIRVYNEGTLDGYAEEITDSIPEGLEFLPSSSINTEYKWRMLGEDGNETDDVTKAVKIVTDYLSQQDEKNKIQAVEEKDGQKVLYYKDVQVQFRVTAVAQKGQENIIKNVAQISEDSNRDIDSNPSRNEEYKENGDNEDDIDYEPVVEQYFDLALRKFITKVNDTDYNNRYPKVVFGEDGEISYEHTKDPVIVAQGDTVIYTIRVYNEGEKDGYAEEITDDLPDGLEFLPEHEINKQYKWKLIDSDGNETTDVTKAVKVTTDYLKDELLKGVIVKDGETVLSYQDIQIAFKVTKSNESDEIIVNIAEISEDSGDDIDSTPENHDPKEDDEDRENLKVEYFDLSLKKWVTEIRVTYNGKTTVTQTGFTEDSDGMAKVDLKASQLSKTTVKFAYKIKVTNEGKVPGYATEIKDYVPKGLEFKAEDNKGWREIEKDVVVTDQLKDTLLNPGESATVEIVLTWKNNTNNMGVKTNYAEISDDTGDDIDSTPNNFKKQEDDIDDAQVILSIKTAGPVTYVGLIFTSISILAVGIFLIKRYII